MRKKFYAALCATALVSSFSHAAAPLARPPQKIEPVDPAEQSALSGIYEGLASGRLTNDKCKPAKGKVPDMDCCSIGGDQKHSLKACATAINGSCADVQISRYSQKQEEAPYIYMGVCNLDLSAGPH